MSTETKVISDETMDLLVQMGIVKFKADFEVNDYASICGGYVEGCMQWCDHNVEDVIESDNDKYVGWTVRFFNNERKELQMYIEKSVLQYIETKCKDWKHTKNTFLKYVKAKY